MLVIVGSGLLAMLAVATWLQPSPEGLGTHQQLGFPPCTFRVVFGVPCPSCGMTTSWSHLVRGDVGAALQANIGGTLLAGLAIALGPWALFSGIRGRWVVCAPRESVVIATGIVVVGITVIDWCVRKL